MDELVVEIHVPLVADPRVPEDDYAFPWIEVIDEFVFEREQQGEAEVFDDSEEFGDVYVFFISGADEDTLLSIASRAAVLDGVPVGAYAMVTHDEAGSFGLGRRVDLPLPRERD
ncbi:hypothetical protein ETD86_20550 [Nonomuraea turkmeniaca]|uniref:Uncharacterized protein n=1 Tax=Nonomuraea turkmeniaca TaxID=103838 RepID=A0A5S4FHQ7_9ACTN|nr:hypothetical protein [Nonomuraea turkmeniaca]TMR19256.1 hypothetical protein ETD86_20550 [Nonomuraea turkmeniaca]